MFMIKLLLMSLLLMEPICKVMELKDFLDVCADFQGMCHNEPEHLEAVNKMLEAMSKK